jgi:hypothetical protein
VLERTRIVDFTQKFLSKPRQRIPNRGVQYPLQKNFLEEEA